MSINVSQLVNRATSINEVTAGNTSGSASSMSFGVVYNKNGKRVTMNKKLAERLGLDDKAHMAFVKEDAVIIVSKDLSAVTDQYLDIDLKDEKDTIKGGITGKKISYSSDAAYGIAHTFELDFSKRSSMSFKDIEIDDTDPDNPAAVIKIKEVA